MRGLRYEFDPDRVAVEVDHAEQLGADEAVSESARFAPDQDLGLRGRRQRWIVARVVAGASLVLMAEEAGCTEREMRRQILDLARKLQDSECLGGFSESV